MHNFSSRTFSLGSRAFSSAHVRFHIKIAKAGIILICHCNVGKHTIGRQATIDSFIISTKQSNLSSLSSVANLAKLGARSTVSDLSSFDVLEASFSCVLMDALQFWGCLRRGGGA